MESDKTQSPTTNKAMIRALKSHAKVLKLQPRAAYKRRL